MGSTFSKTVCKKCGCDINYYSSTGITKSCRYHNISVYNRCYDCDNLLSNCNHSWEKQYCGITMSHF